MGRAFTGHEPMSRSKQFPYKAYVTAFLQTHLFFRLPFPQKNKGSSCSVTLRRQVSYCDWSSVSFAKKTFLTTSSYKSAKRPIKEVNSEEYENLVLSNVVIKVELPPRTFRVLALRQSKLKNCGCCWLLRVWRSFAIGGNMVTWINEWEAFVYSVKIEWT